MTLLLCPDQCTMAWLWAESPVSAKEVLGSRRSSAADPPARGAFTSSREPLARGRLPLEPSAGAVARASPRSGVLAGCARRLLLAPPSLPGAGMPRSRRSPAGDVPPASTCISPLLPPPCWGSSSGPARRPSTAALRAVASSSGHWLATARGESGDNAGGHEAGAAGRPGPPVASQVISAAARTHVDRSRSPVRTSGAPGQPAGRSVRAASIPLRYRCSGCRVCGARRGAGPARGVCARQRASERVCVGGVGRGRPGRRWLRLARLADPLHSSHLAPARPLSRPEGDSKPEEN